MITWAQKVREELIKNYTKSIKCQSAELTAIMLLNGKSVRHDSDTGLYIYEEQTGTGKKDFTPKRKTFNIKKELDLSQDPKKIYKDIESKRAFLRGAFIASGTIVNPEKGYQFEMLTDQDWEAESLQKLMEDFDIYPKILKRRGKYVVYLKEGSAIVDILNVMGAHKALMDFENVRIMNEMRGTVNRQVNCETANINKSVAAAIKQIEDIKLVMAEKGYDNMDDDTKAICDVRIANPDISLSELGKRMNPPLGKSGVSHRLKKISEMAEKIRNAEKSVSETADEKYGEMISETADEKYGEMISENS